MKQAHTLLSLCAITMAAGLIAIGCTGSGLQPPTGGTVPGADTTQGQGDGSQGTTGPGDRTGTDAGTAGRAQDVVTPDTTSPQDGESAADSGGLTDADELTDGVALEDAPEGGPCPGCFGAPCEESLDCNSG